MSLCDDHSLHNDPRMRALAADATRRANERAAMRMMIGEEKWYLTRIGVRNDNAALLKLHRDRFETYYPQLRKMVPMPLAKITVTQRKAAKIMPRFMPKLMPLFPKWLFVRFDLRRGDWRESFQFAGISGLLVERDAERPIPVPVGDAIIAEIRGREINGTVPAEMPVREFAFKVGEVVRMTEGAFRGFDAIVEELPKCTLGELDDDGYCKLTVHLFGRANVVEVPLSYIVKR